MRPFSVSELEKLQGVQEEAMQDTCLHLIRTEGSADSMGLPAVTYAEGYSYEAGLNESPGRKLLDLTNVPEADAMIRLAIELVETIGVQDRLRITHRFGVALETDIEYEIAGPAHRGPSGLLFPLKRVKQ